MDPPTTAIEQFDFILVNIGQVFGMKGIGKYQVLHMLTVLAGMMSSAFIMYSMLYLEHEPAYLC